MLRLGVVFAISVFLGFSQTGLGQTDTCAYYSGQVIAKVATRGTLQYLIKINDELYYPENMPKTFQEDSLKVIVRYRLKDKMDTVYKPAPNDLLEFDFLAPSISIKQIKRKNNGEKCDDPD